MRHHLQRARGGVLPGRKLIEADLPCQSASSLMSICKPLHFSGEGDELFRDDEQAVAYPDSGMDRVYESAYTPEAFAATTPIPEQIQQRMSEGPMWVVLKDSTIVGPVSVVAKSEGLSVRGMAVLPSAGQRIGPLLLEHVKRFASRQRCERLFLSTTPFLTHVIRLYEQWGFRRSDEGPHELFGTPLFTRVKTLSTPTESDGV